MMDKRFVRTEMLLGPEKTAKLRSSKVAVFGIGGVGGYAVEALCRSGIGQLDLYDHDKVCISNINRQIHATDKTIGMYKVDAAKERILDINPDTTVNCYRLFYLPETSDRVDLSRYDYIIDAIDTVAGKIELAVRAHECGVSVISSMGAGNKMNITDFEVADIYDTSVCPLAKVMRRELRARGVPALKVVCSKEVPAVPLKEVSAAFVQGAATQRKQPPGSNAFVPAAVGLILAGEVVKDLTGCC